VGETETQSKIGLVRRDPAQVKAFWDNVRENMWIDEDEIYSAEDASSHYDSSDDEDQRGTAAGASVADVTTTASHGTEQRPYHEHQQHPRPVESSPSATSWDLEDL